LATIAVGSLTWETLQLPLYTVWRDGTLSEQVFAVVHCTGGDTMIALSSLVLALVLVGGGGWKPVVVLTLVLGIAYTGFSEYLNVHVRRTWAYSEWMPVIPLGPYGIGLSPIAQWLAVPGFSMWVASRSRERPMPVSGQASPWREWLTGNDAPKADAES
jgi:hypothetical protein